MCSYIEFQLVFDIFTQSTIVYQFQFKTEIKAIIHFKDSYYYSNFLKLFGRKNNGIAECSYKSYTA